MPDTSLSIREGAIAAWPGAWQGAQPAQHRHGPGHRRRPAVARAGPEGPRLAAVHRRAALGARSRPSTATTDARPAYHGTFWSARKHVLPRARRLQEPGDARQARCASSERPRRARCAAAAACAAEALAVTFAGPLHRRAVNALPFAELVAAAAAGRRAADAGAHGASRGGHRGRRPGSAPTSSPASRCCSTSAWATSAWAAARRRSRPARPSGCGSRPSCARGSSASSTSSTSPRPGLHPADAEPLLDVLDRLKASGNSLFVVEHDLDVVRRADWVVDIGPGAGEGGGQVLYSGPVAGLEEVEGVRDQRAPVRPRRAPRRTSPASRTAGCTCAASRGTTCRTSRSTCRCAC